jgi:hypothetical protein
LNSIVGAALLALPTYYLGDVTREGLELIAISRFEHGSNYFWLYAASGWVFSFVAGKYLLVSRRATSHACGR